MKTKAFFTFFFIFWTTVFSMVVTDQACAGPPDERCTVITSDELLADMARALLPDARYRVEAIFPPGQCPGHYDIKFSDIEKIQKAGLVIYSRSMTFMGKPGARRLLIDSEGRNWMAPDSYLLGVERLAQGLAGHFPEHGQEIEHRRQAVTRLVREEAQKLKERMQKAGIEGLPVLASSMQKELLTWMGFRVAGVYGRPEALSARDAARLVKTGKAERVVAVVDNLQSGPEAGIRIAEALGRPHIVLTNYPSEEGYPAALRNNVEAVLNALGCK